MVLPCSLIGESLSGNQCESGVDRTDGAGQIDPDIAEEAAKQLLMLEDDDEMGEFGNCGIGLCRQVPSSMQIRDSRFPYAHTDRGGRLRVDPSDSRRSSSSDLRPSKILK